MALSDRVTARYSSRYLISLTNSDVESSSSVNTTILGLAATDAAAKFKKIVGVAYDDTNSDHHGPAAKLAVVFLNEWSGKHGDELTRLRDEVNSDLELLAKTAGRDRILPKTTSVVEESSEDVPGVTDRPWADRSRFDGIIPNDPPARE